MERKWFLRGFRRWAYATLPLLAIGRAYYAPRRPHSPILVIRSSVVSLDRHALGGQLLLRGLVLGEARQLHAAQDVGRLGELDVVVAHDLDAIAPGIEKIQEPPGQQLDAGGLQGAPRRLLVVDHQAEMAAIIGRL